MKYKKKYSRPQMEVFKTETVTLLSASFNENMDSNNAIDNYFEIL